MVVRFRLPTLRRTRIHLDRKRGLKDVDRTR